MVPIVDPGYPHRVEQDILVQGKELLSGIDSWEKFLSADPDQSVLLEEKNRTGRPFGSDGFYEVIEKLSGCDTRPGNPGRPVKIIVMGHRNFRGSIPHWYENRRPAPHRGAELRKVQPDTVFTFPV